MHFLSRKSFNIELLDIKHLHIKMYPIEQFTIEHLDINIFTIELLGTELCVRFAPVCPDIPTDYHHKTDICLISTVI